MSTPSIKGGAFVSVVEDVNRLLDRHGPMRGDLEVRLAAEDLEYLRAPIQPALWYPIESYRRMAELLAEIEGGGRREYLMARGARTAERLFNEGLYQQLRYADEVGVPSTREAVEKAIRLIITLYRSMFNFSDWSLDPDSRERGCFDIHVHEAAHFPEVLRYAAQGYVEFIAKRAGGDEASVTSERLEPDHILFTVKLPD